MAGKSFVEYGNENGVVPGQPVYSAIQVTTALSMVVGAWQVRFCITNILRSCILSISLVSR